MNRSSRLYLFLKKCESPPDNSWFWLLMSVLYNTAMVVLGRVLFASTCKDKKRCYVLIPNFSLGDAAILYRSYPELLNSNGMSNPTVIAEERLSKAIKAIITKSCFALPAWKIIPLCKAFLFTPWRYSNVVISTPWHFFDITSTSLNSMRMPPCTISELSKKTIFSQNGMLGNSVVLSPYEQSYKNYGEMQLPAWFWVELAEELKAHGFWVFTNCDGVKDAPVKGTDVFFPKFIEIAGAVEYAGACVSVRSGFTDWCSSALTAKQIVLYPSKKYYEQFRMDHTWGRNDIVEIIYDVQENKLSELRQAIILQIVGDIDE